MTPGEMRDAIEARIRGIQGERDAELGMPQAPTPNDRAIAFDEHWLDATAVDYEMDDHLEGEIDGLLWVLALLDRAFDRDASCWPAVNSPP